MRRSTPARAARAGIGLVAAAAAIAAIMYVRGREPESRSPAQAPTPQHLVLITVDTLRADRVGAYGWSAARTPAMDGLAAGGVHFERAFAAAPITLPSHASLLTGLYPPGHRSRHNGLRAAADVATLATMLREQGYATGAFVAAFPLDRRFGLDRGFDRYGDRMPRDADGRQLNERPGSAVVNEAAAWLAGVRAPHVFLWVHLFEPHTPYESDPSRGAAGARLPAEVRYDDEVARADVAVGRLLGALGPRAASTLIVLAGDHGEAFGEHGETTHSHFVYDTTLRVPLIVAGPGVPARLQAIGQNVSLVDVLPTVMDALGLPQRDVDGISLMPVIRGGDVGARAIYAETFAPLLDFGWSSLRSIRSGNWKYIEAPTPELFDLSADPGELRNLAPDHADVTRDLARSVLTFSGPELPRIQAGDRPAGDAQRRLGALGYVSTAPAASARGGRPDPKDRKEQAKRMAQVVSGELRGPALELALEAILAEDPRNGQAHMRLGFTLSERGDAGRAERHFRAAIEAAVPGADAYLGLAMCLSMTGRGPEAARILEAGAHQEPENPVIAANLGTLAMDAGDNARAERYLNGALAVDPDLHQARFNLSRVLARTGRRTQALEQTEELLARLPAGAPQRPEVERLKRALQ